MGRESHKYTVAVDMDGVLHSYASPWVSAETIPDPPVPGAIEWLNEIHKKFDIVIFTTRGATSPGQEAVLTWLRDNGYTGPLPKVTAVKPAALLYIDDRAYRFDGTNFPTAEEIHRLRPWNKP